VINSGKKNKKGRKKGVPLWKTAEFIFEDPVRRSLREITLGRLGKMMNRHEEGSWR